MNNLKIQKGKNVKTKKCKNTSIVLGSEVMCKKGSENRGYLRNHFSSKEIPV